MQSLYIHFPFCEVKCHYCDFYSIGQARTRQEDPARFETALTAEFSQNGSLLSNRLETIFFGGGTPSMTHYDSVARALAPLWKHTSVLPTTEWTMEANPSSIELKSMQAFHALGINRVSIGVQALRPELLQALGRIHSREAALQALETVFAAGIKNVSVDLLCGVPEQSESDLKEALKTLTQFPITHLSCYLLTLPKHHKMFPQLPSDEVQLAHLLLVHDWLTEAGFEHYEISNFAKPGKKAQHNLRYWQGHSYLGVGPSAHSYDASRSKRWKNISSLHKYSELLGNHQSVIEWTETLSPKQLELEKWMLAIRLNEGFPEEWLRPEGLRSKATVFQQEGLLEIHPHNPQRLRLTPKGFALSDQILRSLV